MAPADPKDWLLAATALTTMAVSPALANDAPQAGVVTGALSSTRQEGQAADAQRVVLGDIVRPGEKFQTGPDGIIHILFLDQSSLTLGPNSDVTLDSFSHNAETRTGKIILSLHEGSLRVVGGINSKKDATEVRTPGGTVSILGGITAVSVTGGTTQATFLFGTSMTVSSGDQTQTVTRPGFSVSSGEGQTPSPPTRLPQGQLSTVLSSFEASGSQQGGSTQNSVTTVNTPTGNATGGAPTPSSSSLIASSDLSSSGQGSAASTMATDRLSSPSSLVGNSIFAQQSDGSAMGGASTLAKNDIIRLPSIVS